MFVRSIGCRLGCSVLVGVGVAAAGVGGAMVWCWWWSVSVRAGELVSVLVSVVVLLLQSVWPLLVLAALWSCAGGGQCRRGRVSWGWCWCRFCEAWRWWWSDVVVWLVPPVVL